MYVHIVCQNKRAIVCRHCRTDPQQGIGAREQCTGPLLQELQHASKIHCSSQSHYSYGSSQVRYICTPARPWQSPRLVWMRHAVSIPYSSSPQAASSCCCLSFFTSLFALRSAASSFSAALSRTWTAQCHGRIKASGFDCYAWTCTWPYD